MELVSLEDCRKIAKKCLGSGNVDVLRYEMTSSTEAGAGFIGASKILRITARKDGKPVELEFFTKTLPENEYHRKNVDDTRVFFKEAEVFKSVLPSISKYFAYKIAPKCCHSDPEKLLVFENLASQGYKNYDSSKVLDVDHCKVALSRLASFHASSFLHEKATGSTMDAMFPDIMVDQINYFKNEEGHFGYQHCQTGARALGVVLNQYFPHVASEVRTNVKNLLASNPSLLSPSKTYRNALAHADLWCNNMMFKYDSSNRITDCVLVDYQLLGYCPPSVDVYSMIFIVSNKEFRKRHTNELAEFYYDNFCNCIRQHGENPEEFLTKKEFDESVSEAVPVALTNTAIFLHHILLPDNERDKVFGDLSATKRYMEKDRSSVILRALEENEFYRKRVLDALSDCVDYFTGTLVI